ncbi:hypothetical protein [Bordetella avium]|uniref:hypothetical protein n=1 Tax=Bordetella avium TaxID=521 RepID=UPI000FD9B0C0|nr:hypothetical protein [Bordetella avium]
MTTKHTPGPWKCQLAKSGSGRLQVSGPRGEQIAILWRSSKETTEANARLIAAAPDLLEALEEAIDLAWIEDSHQVQFDTTVMFSEFYDFSRLDGPSRIEFYGQHSCIVWPGSKWSAYCTYDGSMWFEAFDTAAEAKEACMRLLDKVLPDHPAMRARAAIAKATGQQP